MHDYHLLLKNTANLTLLHEMQESLLFLQNSYHAVIVTMMELLDSNNPPAQNLLETLHLEIQLTNSEIARLQKLIQHQLALIETNT